MNHVQITVLGIGFIFFTTLLGSALVFCFKNRIPRRLNAGFAGFSAGVMTAASVWSLLLPALNETSTSWGELACIPIVVGMLLGALILTLMDRITKRLYNRAQRMQDTQNEKNISSSAARSMKLFTAVTLHNIPEGLAVGFAFGVAFAFGTRAAFLSALWVAIGIGIQNFPEGAAVALPLKDSLNSRKKAFLLGTISGAVEPIFAVIGLFLAAWLRFLQPWLLSMAAGAMLFVVSEDLLPELSIGGDQCRVTGAWGMLLGFIVMMALDVSFG